MIIRLSPARSEKELRVEKSGDTLSLNGAILDFTALQNGCSLPASAVACAWIDRPVERVNGELVLTIILPHGADASERSRIPADIVNPPDGKVSLPTDQDPRPEPSSPTWVDTVGVIDWSQMVTAEMKQEAAAAQHLAAVQADAAARRAAADSAIAPLQDAVDIDDATDAEVLALKAWKKYRVALNRLPDQPGYPTDIDWPAPPA
ncbi:tail fiber assembly protein [Pseudomonas qingdaonensis]|uniref:tail fiber assembly protein n=1 Tax=Pseudomonas qingdaonensis TaxID=2056231 RepID=UPI0023EECACF|nr:tail fiber assembly protein [Pseudomonas qingdaonensis]